MFRHFRALSTAAISDFVLVVAIVLLAVTSAPAQSASAPLHIPPLLGSAITDDQPDAPSDTPDGSSPLHNRVELQAFLDGVVGLQLSTSPIAGAAVAVVVDRRPFFSKGYGYADVETHRKVDPSTTMFRLGSVSKPFTWTAVMQLVEQGKLDLETDVNKYLDGPIVPATFPEPIALKHLMTHTAGFEDRVVGTFAVSSRELPPLDELIRTQMPARVRPPGRLAAYSNFGAALAAAVVAHAAKVPWENYIEEHILKPLEMTHTSVRQPPEAHEADLSQGYGYFDGWYEPEPFELFTAAPAGGMSGSADDLARFMAAHLQDGALDSHRILQPETVQRMRTVLFRHDPHLDGMCYGWFELHRNGRRILYHDGALFWFHSTLALLPDEGVGLFAAYNTDTAANAGQELLETFLDHYYPADPPPLREPSPQFAARTGKYAGQYAMLRNSSTDLSRLQGLLDVVDVNAEEGYLALTEEGATTPFVEVEPRVFEELGGHEKLVFAENARGEITHLFLNSEPSTALEKLPWQETPRFQMRLLGACTVVFMTAVAGWPLVLLANRKMTPRGRRTRGSQICSWVGWLACLSGWAFVYLAVDVLENSDEIAFGLQPSLHRALLIPQISAVLFAAMFICGILAWKNWYWRLSGRLHYTLSLLAGAGFFWLLSQWNLLYFGL